MTWLAAWLALNVVVAGLMWRRGRRKWNDA